MNLINSLLSLLFPPKNDETNSPEMAKLLVRVYLEDADPDIDDRRKAEKEFPFELPRNCSREAIADKLTRLVPDLRHYIEWTRGEASTIFHICIEFVDASTQELISSHSRSSHRMMRERGLGMSRYGMRVLQRIVLPDATQDILLYLSAN